jgi:hypothetical protein
MEVSGGTMTHANATVTTVPLSSSTVNGQPPLRVRHRSITLLSVRNYEHGSHKLYEQSRSISQSGSALRNHLFPYWLVQPSARGT